VSDDILEMLPVDWLEPFLLLGLRERGCYGQELTQKMVGFGFGTRRPGAMYSERPTRRVPGWERVSRALLGASRLIPRPSSSSRRAVLYER
jgi:hypothetical protein